MSILYYRFADQRILWKNFDCMYLSFKYYLVEKQKNRKIKLSLNFI